jgi:hypothetical protein
MKDKVKEALLIRIQQRMMEIPQVFWGDASADEEIIKVALLHSANVQRALEIYDVKKVDLMKAIFKNAKWFNIYRRIPTNSAHDCSGRLCCEEFFVKRVNYSVALVKIARFDF